MGEYLIFCLPSLKIRLICTYIPCTRGRKVPDSVTVCLRVRQNKGFAMSTEQLYILKSVLITITIMLHNCVIWCGNPEFLELQAASPSADSSEIDFQPQNLTV